MLAVIAAEAGGPDVLQVREVETPQAGAGEVLVKVVAAGVNRADLLQRQGHYPPPAGASEILGLECSGEIAEVGEQVIGWQVGDACVALLAGGGYAEYVAVQAGQVIKPPDGIDRITAAGLVEVAATVTSTMAIAGLSAGDFFLVHGGSGGVGSFAIQHAKAVGASAMATAGSDAKLGYCAPSGRTWRCLTATTGAPRCRTSPMVTVSTSSWTASARSTSAGTWTCWPWVGA